MKGLPYYLLSLFAFLLVACSTAVTPAVEPNDAAQESAKPHESPQPVPTKVADVPVQDKLLSIQPIEEIDLETVPAVDTTLHSVPLEAIIFDTFRAVNRAVPLPDAQPALIRSLQDAIPPIYAPRFRSAAETNAWLADDDLVLGYADGGEAYAYPVKILNFHEIVAQEVNGRSILASYCPLCRSGIVYDRLLPGTNAPLVMGNTSALYESDMVMFDHQTGSYWNQVSGEAIVGPLTGQQLLVLPSQMVTWGQWKALHAETLALSENSGFDRNYRRDPFVGYGESLNAGGGFFFPVSEAGLDPRLDPAEVVLSVMVDGVQRAYPLTQLGDAVVHEMLGETPVVVFSMADGPGGAAFVAQDKNGRLLTFIRENDQIQDMETGSTWNIAGEATAGELIGSQLVSLPTRSTFWFSTVANFPDIEIYQPQN